ncbi:MAG: TA system VapC family ribonuclease toxin [Bryobacteraceae bacterium]
MAASPRLVDVNVWLALLAAHHEHRPRALAWFDSLQAGEAGLCRLVQLSLVRLLSNAKVMGQNAIATRDALDVVDSLMEDERVVFWTEPVGMMTLLPRLLRYTSPTPNLVTDAYLAAFAMAKQCPVTTIDAGFRQFTGLAIEPLSPTSE